MIRIVNQKVNDTNYPKKVICEQCGEELEYEREDERIGLFGYNVIKCPCCGEDVLISEQRMSSPIFPTSFYHFGKEDSVKLTEEQTQNYIDEVVAKLAKLKVGDYTFSGSGDTMVYGFRYEDEDIIQVCKNYYEDTIFKE